MELFERVGYVADKNITKNSFFLKLCKEDLEFLDEPPKDQFSSSFRQKSSSFLEREGLNFYGSKGMSVDE